MRASALSLLFVNCKAGSACMCRAILLATRRQFAAVVGHRGQPVQLRLAFVRPRSAQRPPPESSDRGHHDGPTTCVVWARARSRRRWYPLTACLPLAIVTITNPDTPRRMRYMSPVTTRCRCVPIRQHRYRSHHQAQTHHGRTRHLSKWERHPCTGSLLVAGSLLRTNCIDARRHLTQTPLPSPRWSGPRNRQFRNSAAGPASVPTATTTSKPRCAARRGPRQPVKPCPVETPFCRGLGRIAGASAADRPA